MKTSISGILIDLKAIKIILEIRITDNMLTFLKSLAVVSCKSEYMADSPVKYHSP